MKNPKLKIHMIVTKEMNYPNDQNHLLPFNALENDIRKLNELKNSLDPFDAIEHFMTDTQKVNNWNCKFFGEIE